MIAALTLALLAQTPMPGLGQTVVGVEVRAPAGADRAALDREAAKVTLRKGQVLTRRAVREALEGLYASQQYADVSASTVAEGGGVRVVLEVVPRQVIGEIFVEGAHVVPTSELVAATRLSVNSEYWPERAQQAAEMIAEVYARRGYLDATVETSLVPREGGVDVGFLVVEGQPSTITALSFVGLPGLPLEALVYRLGLRPGDVLDLDRLAEGVEAVRALLRSEGHFRARVDPAVVDAHGRVVIPVAAGPRFRVSFRGNRSLPDTTLSAVTAWDGAEPLDDVVAARLAQRVQRFYAFRGFHDARVVARELPGRQPGEAVLAFDVEEGLPLRVTDIEFVGNRAVGQAELRGLLMGAMESAAPEAPLEAHSMGDPLSIEGREPAVVARALPAPPLDTVFVEEAWREAQRAMTARYREKGYLSAAVRLTQVLIADGQARARFEVTEGPRVLFRQVTLQGAPAGFVSNAVDLKAPSGAPFSAEALDAARAGVVRELGRKGYLFAQVDASWHLDPTGQWADGQLAVKPGPLVRTRRVLSVGQARTFESVILAQATMVEGLPLDAEMLFTTQNNLVQLGAFKTVDVEMLAPETPEALKTVVVRVKERPRVTGELGFGYFVDDGPRVVVDGSAPNLAGRAVNLSGHGQLNFFALSAPALAGLVDVSDLAAWEKLGGRGNLSLQNRGLLPANVGARLDMVVERVFRRQFRFTRLAAVPSLDWSTYFEIPRVEWTRPKLTLQLQYEVEWSRVLRTGGVDSQQVSLTLIDQERLRFLYGMFALQTARFAPTLDLRDNPLVPTRGVLLQGTAEVTGALATEDEQGRTVPVRFIKWGGLASVYLPVARRTVLALSARTGRIVPLVDGSVTPPVKRFFLGGSTSMRGFNEDQLLAEDQRAEYRAELKDCVSLASHEGCTTAANTILKGKQVPSQGGESFAVFKAELRFPAFSVLDLGLFVEAGNLWLAPPKALWPLRTVAGAGLRYVTPIGPLALDLGVNLAPDLLINEPQFVGHFNIGVF